MFDENNTEKKFVGSQKLNKSKRHSNAHKMVKKVGVVVHNGRDIKNAYSDAGKTLFSTMRETMNSERS